MTSEDFLTNVRTQYGNQRTRDGRLVSDIEDKELMQKMLDRYPGERDNIEDIDTYLSEDELTDAPAKTDVQTRLDETKKGLFARIGDRFNDMTTKAQEVDESGFNPASKFLQTAGAGAEFITGSAIEGAKSLTPEFIEKPVTEAISKGAEAIAGTPVAQKIGEKYGEFSEAHPELAGNIEAVGSIAEVLPVGKAVGTVGNVAKKAGEKVLEKPLSAIAEAKRLKDEAEKLEYVTPKPTELTPTEYEKALSRGRISPKTNTETAKYNLSDSEKTIAKKYINTIDKDPVKTSINIFDQVDKLDTEVGNFLKGNNGIFNKGELRNKLLEDLEDVDDITLDSDRVARAKENIVNNFTAKLAKNDMHSLWEARKDFDRSIEKAFSGSPSLQKEIKVKFRNAVQDFISDGTPDTTYKDYMKDMSNLLRLQETVATKAAKQRGLDAIHLWMKEHPKTMKTIGWTAVGLGAGGALNAI